MYFAKNYKVGEFEIKKMKRKGAKGKTSVIKNTCSFNLSKPLRICCDQNRLWFESKISKLFIEFIFQFVYFRVFLNFLTTELKLLTQTSQAFREKFLRN